MGFEFPKTTYRLNFEGTELEGLEVRMRGGKLGDAFAAVGDLSGVDITNATVADAKAILQQYEDMAAHLVSWNATDAAGNAIPADLKGLQAQETRHVNMIAAAWQRAQVDVPGPLERDSRNSPSVDTSSIRMESLPASLAS